MTATVTGGKTREENEQGQGQEELKLQQGGRKLREHEGRALIPEQEKDLCFSLTKHPRVKAFPISNAPEDVPAGMQIKTVYFVRHAEGKHPLEPVQCLNKGRLPFLVHLPGKFVQLCTSHEQTCIFNLTYILSFKQMLFINRFGLIACLSLLSSQTAQHCTTRHLKYVAGQPMQIQAFSTLN